MGAHASSLLEILQKKTEVSSWGFLGKSNTTFVHNKNRLQKNALRTSQTLNSEKNTCYAICSDKERPDNEYLMLMRALTFSGLLNV